MQWQPPALHLFQLFGFAAHARPAATRGQLVARLGWPTCVVALKILLATYVFRTKLTFGAVNQVNVKIDKLVLLTGLTTDLTAVFESLCKYRQTQRLFERVRRISAQLAAATVTDAVVVGDVRYINLHNWLQSTVLAVDVALGIALTGVQSWLYYRWMVCAQLSLCVRSIEVATHIEMLANLLAGVERVLHDAAAGLPLAAEQRAVQTRRASRLYGECREYALAISAAFGWSMLAISVHTLNGLATNAFWLSQWMIAVWDDIA